MSRGRMEARVGGFSMIEALAAVALTATIVMALAAVAGQWLPNWSRGFAGLQRADILAIALERLCDDLTAAEYVTPSSDTPGPLFEGAPSSVTLVRSAIGPNASPRLEVVRFAEIKGDRGLALSRTNAAFAPSAAGAGAFAFGDPAPLVRAPLRVSFAYAGHDRAWVDAWSGKERLPDAVRITVRDASAHGAIVASTAVRIRTTAPGAPKLVAQGGSPNAPAPAPAPNAPPAAPTRSD